MADFQNLPEEKGVRVFGWRLKLILAIERWRNKDRRTPWTFVIRFQPGEHGEPETVQIFRAIPSDKIEVDDLIEQKPNGVKIAEPPRTAK